MNSLAETAVLLGIVAAIDRREVDDLLVQSWYETLIDVSFDEARYAVNKHYSREHRYLMPADIRGILAAGMPHPSVGMRGLAIAQIEAYHQAAVSPEKAREYAVEGRAVLAAAKETAKAKADAKAAADAQAKAAQQAADAQTAAAIKAARHVASDSGV